MLIKIEKVYEIHMPTTATIQQLYKYDHDFIPQFMHVLNINSYFVDIQYLMAFCSEIDNNK